MNEMAEFSVVEAEELPTNVVDLSVHRQMRKTGGGGSSGGKTWDLRLLLPGTEFATTDNTQMYPWLLREWCLIGHKSGISYVCHVQTQNDPASWLPVDPEEFSKAFSLKAITEEP